MIMTKDYYVFKIVQGDRIFMITEKNISKLPNLPTKNITILYNIFLRAKCPLYTSIFFLSYLFIYNNHGPDYG